MRYENKEYVLDNDVPKLREDATPDKVTAYTNHYDESTKVVCLMLVTMASSLHKNFENWGAYDINPQLKEVFQDQARKEEFDIVKSLIASKKRLSLCVCTHPKK